MQIPNGSLRYFLFIFLINANLPKNYAQPEVTIPQGTLQGLFTTTRDNRSVASFYGIPYAEPPIGNLRFANPVAAGTWDGILNATDDTRVCPQLSGDGAIGNEDCLYLNVYTPELPECESSTLLPVMVFIHGGSFVIGSKKSLREGPGYLLDEDVILVVMNYRLGALGFLSTGDEVASGNWALKDQILALQWVRDNIEYFGGDPNKVTLFGESAGACAVHILTLSSSTTGLYNKYITQSGSVLSPWCYRPSADFKSQAYGLAEYVGCSNDTTSSLISCLRTADVSKIVLKDSILEWNQQTTEAWSPTDEPDIEGAVITDSPMNILTANGFRDLPWISGVLRDEGLISSAIMYVNESIIYEFLDNIETLLPIALSWPYVEESVISARASAIMSYYFKDYKTLTTSELIANYTRLNSDSQYIYPARKALELQHAFTEYPQYFYSFDYRGTFSASYLYSGSTEDYGAAHGDDTLYLFPSDILFTGLNQTMSDTDYQIVDTIVQLWTSFATDGIPTAKSLESEWEQYSTEDAYLRIGNSSNTDIEIEHYFLLERMQFWDNLYATTYLRKIVERNETRSPVVRSLVRSDNIACDYNN